MNDILEAEIEGIVDKQLQECGFIDLCTRIAQKVVEKVQKIEEDHGIIKDELNGIEERLNFLFGDKFPSNVKPPSMKNDVIVIEEEEEERKPLIARLHEITKSTQEYNSEDLQSTKHITLTTTEDVALTNNVPSRDVEINTVIENQSNRTPLGREQNDSSSVVYKEHEKNYDKDPSAKPKDLGKKDNELESGNLETEHEKITGIQIAENSTKSASNLTKQDSSQNVSELEQQIGSKRSNDGEVTESRSPIPVELNDEKVNEVIKERSEDKMEISEKEQENTSNSGDKDKENAEILVKEVVDEEDLADESYEFKEGDRVLGKPEKSDIWYTAKILKIILNKYHQKRYQVKFDSGFKLHGSLPGNNLAPIAHPRASSLNVGSRVVAIRPRDTVDARIQKKYMNLYSSVFAKGEILYGGVVVERSCGENRHRFLVFFDDGFAQYMNERKMHLVIHASENVWQDVSIHCREFIKEYLEEYPDRPMLKVKPGLSLQTEWNGNWLQAKVIAVDCSLVKMLFDVDKRTEWIYRGSTRLEPLYSELERRDLEALKSKNKKSNKKKKSSISNTKKAEPYVEDAITKPCFGISKFSKIDPQGLQQIKEWGPVEEKFVPPPQDDPMMSDSEISTTESPVKVVASDTRTTNRKRKIVEKTSSDHMSDTSTDWSTIENEAGSTRTQGKKDVTIGITAASPINSPSPKNSPLSKPLRRHSSQSSIDSVASDSQLLPKHKKHGRLERQLSNQSIQSTQSDRTDLQSHGISQVRRKSSSSDVNKSPGSLKPSSISRSQSSTTRTLSNERTSSTRPVYRPILPRPQQQKQVQHWSMSESDVRISLPQVFLPNIMGPKALPHAKNQPEITSNIITLHSLAQSFPKIRGPHECSKSCIIDVHLPRGEMQKHNPLSIPLLLGWTRETAKRKPGYHRDIYYRAPCSRRLRNMAEVSRFLLQTKASNVTIDQFSFDPSVSCRDQIPLVRMPRLRIDDISCGKEKHPIPCVNEKNNEAPPVVEYVSERIIGQGIDINTDSGFLPCCNCTDNCQDKTKCPCVRLTIDSSDAIDGKKDDHTGYHYRRLKECITTGIYECNANCECSSLCHNRVVQNGITARLQVFMTDSKGWGLRCLDDIPRGTFICTYSGQILNEDMADKEGKDCGDEYLAELDHIEIVEKAKEGYESDVPELRDENKSLRRMSFEDSVKGYDSDSDESEFGYSTSSDSIETAFSGNTSFKELTAQIRKSENQKEERKSSSSNFIDLTLESDPENDETTPNTEITKTDANLGNANLGNANVKFATNAGLLDRRSSSSLELMLRRLKSGSADDDVTRKSQEKSILKNSTGMTAKDEDKNDSQKQLIREESPSPMFFIDSSDDENMKFNAKEEKTKNLKSRLHAEKANERKADERKVEVNDGMPKEKPFEVNGKSKLKDDTSQIPRSDNGSKVTSDQQFDVKIAMENVAPTIRKAVAKKSTRSVLFQRLANKKCENDDEGGDKNRSFNSSFDNDVKTNFFTRVLEGALGIEMNPGKTFTSPRSSTGGHFARKPIGLKLTPPGQQQQQSHESQQQQNSGRSTRQLFGEEECYVIDAKSYGNVGRYLNHSCMPNLFVQNVFINTHDLRFPFVAFFAQQNIPALSELTWDYSYEVGSVPGKVLQCHCGAIECRGRLL